MQITGGSLATLNFYTQPYNSNNNTSNNKLEKKRKKFATAKAANALSRTKLKGNSKGERR